MKEVERRNLLGPAAAIVAPDAFVQAVVEVVLLLVFDLGLGGREQLLDELHMRVHRAADIKKQKNPDCVATLWPCLYVDVSMLSR